MKANRAARAGAWAADDSGAFPVVEAILVVILVLTAILFFTSVQRPTTGSEAGGIDLGQVAADTLRIVQLREFDATATTGAPYPGGADLALEEWVTNLMAGDGPAGAGRTAAAVDEFLEEILPTGARYSLRLSNGVESVQVLPQGRVEVPQGATASEILFLPNWTAYQAQPPRAVVAPGQMLDASHAAYAWTDSTSAIDCVKSPLGQSTGPDGPDTGTAGDQWFRSWQRTAGQVPFNLTYGTWAGYAGYNSATNECTGSPTQYVKVVRDASNLRVVTDGVLSDGSPSGSQPANRVTSATAAFTAADQGKSIRAIKADGTRLLPDGTTINAASASPAGYESATSVRVSGSATADNTGVTLLVGIDNPYPPYGLQLVVWFGA